MNTQLWRRVAVGAATGAAGYLAVRAIRRTTETGATAAGTGSYRRAVTIYRAPAEVYAFCRDQPNLAETIGHVARVDVVDDRRSRWIVEGPGGAEGEFDIEIVNDDPQVLLDWRAVAAPVPHEGSVAFTQAPGGRGTEVRVVVNIPVAALPPSADVERLLYDALRRVKQVMEAGEVIRGVPQVVTGGPW